MEGRIWSMESRRGEVVVCGIRGLIYFHNVQSWATPLADTVGIGQGFRTSPARSVLKRASAGRPRHAARIYRQSYRSRERPIRRDLIWGISTEICGLEMTERQRANHGSEGAASGRGVRGSENRWGPPSLLPSLFSRRARPRRPRPRRPLYRRQFSRRADLCRYGDRQSVRMSGAGEDFHPKDKHCSPQRSVKRDAPFSTPVLLQTRKDDNNINEICKRLS